MKLPFVCLEKTSKRTKFGEKVHESYAIRFGWEREPLVVEKRPNQ